jgi:DNA-binding beta-propeller fold protein YncE
MPRAARRASYVVVCFFFLIISVIGCSDKKESLFYGSLGLNRPLIFVASAKTTSNLGTNAVVVYNLEGALVQQIADFTQPGLRPRGIAYLDPFNVLVTVEGGARAVLKNALFGGYTTLISSSDLTGSLQQIVRYEGSGSTLFYAIQGNTIDAFTQAGARIASTSTPVIDTTTSSCVLNSPRGLAVDDVNKRLFVTNAGSTSLLVYDLSTPTAPTCQQANSSMGSIVSTGVILHSNGYLYVASSVSPAANVILWALAGDGSGTATAVYTDSSGTVLNLSSSLVELPDGSILIANSGTQQIDKFQVNGLSAATRVGSTAFIKDAFTTLVNAIYVMRGR